MSVVYVAARRDRSPDPLVGTLTFLDPASGVLTAPGGRTAPAGPYALVEVLAADTAEAVADWVTANQALDDDPDTTDTDAAHRLLDQLCEGGPAAVVAYEAWTQIRYYQTHTNNQEVGS